MVKVSPATVTSHEHTRPGGNQDQPPVPYTELSGVKGQNTGPLVYHSNPSRAIQDAVVISHRTTQPMNNGEVELFRSVLCIGCRYQRMGRVKPRGRRDGQAGQSRGADVRGGGVVRSDEVPDRVSA